MYTLSERIKLGLLCLLLLILLGITAFSAANTFQAVKSFQRQYTAAKARDISAIRPWMTIHAISHFYSVPEDYLYYSLHVDNPVLLHHVTLNEIASRKRQPVDQVIHMIQHPILDYRKKHPGMFTPTPQPGMNHFSLTPGGAIY